MAGMNIQMLARAQLAWELTDSKFLVGAVGAGFAPPILLFSLFGGAIADRFEKKRVMQVGQFGTALLGLFVAISIVTDTVTFWHLFGSSVGQGLFFAFLMPSRQAIIPQLVPRDQLTNAVALNAGGMALMTTMAPAAAGFMYHFGGPAVAYFVIAGLSFAAVLLTGRIPTLPKGTGRKGTGAGVFAEIRDGLGYAWRNQTVMLLLAMALGTTVLAMPVRNLLAPYNEEVFGGSSLALGVMMALIGVGALLGTLVIAGLRQTQSRGKVLLLTSFASGVAILLSALLSNYFIVLAVMVLLGIGDSGRRSLNASLIMEQCDDEHRGRVMGIYMMNFGLIPLGVLPLGALADAANIQLAFGVFGVLLLGVVLLMTLATSKIRSL